MNLKKVDLIIFRAQRPTAFAACMERGTGRQGLPPRGIWSVQPPCSAEESIWLKKHLLTKLCIYLHVVEGSPLELVELLLLESSLSGGCSEHIGVGQKKYKNGCLTCICTGSVSQKHIKTISTSGVCKKLQSVSHILLNI